MLCSVPMAREMVNYRVKGDMQTLFQRPSILRSPYSRCGQENPACGGISFVAPIEGRCRRRKIRMRRRWRRSAMKRPTETVRIDVRDWIRILSPCPIEQASRRTGRSCCAGRVRHRHAGQSVISTGFHPDDAKGLTAATDAGKVIAAQIPNRVGYRWPVGSSPTCASRRAATRPRSVAPAAIRARQRMYAPASYPPPPNTSQYREPTPEEKRSAGL